jgi:hypothetical protein
LEELDGVGVKKGKRRILGGRGRGLWGGDVLLGLLGWSVLKALVALLRCLPVEQRTERGGARKRRRLL